MDQPDLGADARAAGPLLGRGLRLVGHTFRSRGRRRDGVRQRHLGQRSLLRGARRAGHPGPDLHDGRRRAARRAGWARRGHQLWLLAAALQRRRRRRRALADARPGAVHGHRRHRSRLLRSRRGPHLRRRHSDRRRAAAAARSQRARSTIVVVAERDGPAQARPERGTGDRGPARRAAADSRGDAARPLAARRPEGLPQRRADAGAGGERRVVPAAAVRAADRRPDGRRRPGAPHRLRQHRQPAAGPNHRAAPRTQRTAGARGVALAYRPAVVRGEPRARADGRGAGPGVRPLGQRPAGQAVVDRHQHGVPRSLGGLADARLHDRRGRGDGAPLRYRTGAAGRTGRAERRVEGSGTQRGSRPACGPRPVAGRGAGRALGGARGGSRALHAHVLGAGTASTWGSIGTRS